jgi:glycosyltransferase involved in cell wall biosynthesis
LKDASVPYAVKVHGSALEYTVKVDPERFLGAAEEGLEPARCVLVGSSHTAQSLWAAMGADDALVQRTRLGPPGVDIGEFAPRPPDVAAAGVRELARRLAERGARASGAGRPGEAVVEAGADAFARDDTAAAAALAGLEPERDRLIAFVGKLIVSKGVDLLLTAFPLVLESASDARLVVVGFGAFRGALEELVAALAAGDLKRVGEIAASGRELEGGPRAPLRYVQAFLDRLEADSTGRRERYLAAAATLAERVVFTGRLAHEELADLLPACEAEVVPSTFPEAFGMVAAEAAACGALPVSADHSGLAEVTHTLAEAVPPAAAAWLSFAVGPESVPQLAERLAAWLRADDALRRATREALVSTARRHYSWEGVARGVLAAAQGELETLISPLQASRDLG